MVVRKKTSAGTVIYANGVAMPTIVTTTVPW
jgi:hypothetical protein